jgi:uncharacterized protein YegP (UPF0339 family)
VIEVKKMLLGGVAAMGLFVGAAATLPSSPARAADKSEARSAGTFEVYKDKAGEFRWRLKSSNGQIIATSGEGYSEKRSCMSAIESVKRAAAEAKIEEIEK